ncbi:MAG: Clp protease N-terminal domain-containing protein [Hyphomicrobiaceae bacterium]
MGGAALATSRDDLIADDVGTDQFRATLRRAQVYAEEQGHRQVTLEHLLLALTEDPDALAVFEASRIDIDRLRDDVAGYVSRIPDRVSGEGGEPALSPELSRVVEAARQAAQQSRRQAVSGAIVLAALIGDGRSPAAEFLKSHGLTFEEAIRTLQARSGTTGRPANPPPPARPAAPPVSTSTDSNEDILASIRDEVSASGEDRSYERARPSAFETPAPTSPFRREPPLGRPQRDPHVFEDQSPPPSLSGGEQRPSAHRPKSGMDAQELELEPQSYRAPPAAEPRTGRPPQRGPISPGGPAANGSAAPPNDRMRMPGGPPPGVPGWRPPGPPPAGATARPMGPPPMGGRPPPPHGQGQPGYGFPPAGPPQASRMGRPPAPANAARPPVDSSVSEGSLLENIPRRMRVATPEQVEVRIARGALEGLGDGMHGQVSGHKVHVAKAMSVRLRAPEGGFYIEATSPETQWIENTLGITSDDFASWRWTVTPHYRGRARLQLVVSARSVGPDGLAAETALPEQIIEVRVRTNYARNVYRIVLWLAAMAAAGVIGAMGEAGFRFFTTIIGG